MFGGFQSNAFQASGFQIIPSDIAPAAIIGGHFADFKNYRSRLKRMLKAAESRDEQRYRKETVGLIEAAVEAGIKQPEVDQLVQEQKKEAAQIDFTLVAQEVNRLLARIEAIIRKQNALSERKRDEEELIFLLALS